MKKIYLEEMFFHITHVCNLTCENCDSYNNRIFKGHFFWNNFNNHYYEWAKKLHIEKINIIGGEPFANPKLLEWVEEISKCFCSTREFKISTNGTYIAKNLDLAMQIIENGFSLDVCVHDPALRNAIEHSLDEIGRRLNAKKVEINSSVSYMLNNKEIIKLYNIFVFFKASIKKIENNVTFFNRSDPIKAHNFCMEECGPSHFFMKGKIYKCYLTAIATDLTSQFEFEDAGTKLLTAYRPADPFDTEDELKLFFEQISNPIEQCTLCAERKVIKPLWPLSKSKVKFNEN